MPLIELNAVTKTFTNGDLETSVLKGVNLSLEKGEFCSIMGASGSGKSTLMYILGCLDRATEGKYILNGINVADCDDNALSSLRATEIGFIFQAFYLVPYLNVLDNVILPTTYDSREHNISAKERALSLLDSLGMADRAYFAPEQLSGGQKQRVAIARALMNNPNILLADEPTGQLDFASSDSVLEIFSHLNSQGKTVIIVTHDPKTASATKRKIVIQDGIIL